MNEISNFENLTPFLTLKMVDEKSNAFFFGNVCKSTILVSFKKIPFFASKMIVGKQF
jgi:hypothetical protein